MDHTLIEDQVSTYIEISNALFLESIIDIDENGSEYKCEEIQVSQKAKDIILPYYIDEEQRQKHLQFSSNKDGILATSLKKLKKTNRINTVFDFVSKDDLQLILVYKDKLFKLQRHSKLVELNEYLKEVDSELTNTEIDILYRDDSLFDVYIGGTTTADSRAKELCIIFEKLNKLDGIKIYKFKCGNQKSKW